LQRTPDDDRYRSKHVALNEIIALKEIIECCIRRNSIHL